MKTSESIVNITKALVTAKLAFKPVIKDRTNPAFKDRPVKYADLGAYLDAAEPALLANGILIIQSPDVADPGMVQLSTRLQHASGEWIECVACIPLARQDAQAFGSALSYLRRYSLSAMLSLAAEDDDGNASVPKPALVHAVAQATPLSKAMTEKVNAWRESILCAVDERALEVVSMQVTKELKALAGTPELSELAALKAERLKALGVK